MAPKPSNKGKVKTAMEVSAPASKPDWPPLNPLVPLSDLSLDTVLEDQIILVHGLFTSSLCRKYVAFLSSLPLVTTPGQPKKGDALRVNDRFQVDDPVFAEQLWSSTGLKHLISESPRNWGGEPCGLNPRIRIYRYGKGQFFDQHYDASDLIILPTEPPTAALTTWTLLLYLTGPSTGCVGGETVFYPELGAARNFTGKFDEGSRPFVVGLEVGMALLHKHGNDCLLHEGREVIEGEKWVIRSDLCVKRPPRKGAPVKT